MAKSRSRTVTESLDMLLWQERRMSEPDVQKIRILRLIKQQPELPLEAIAEQAGCSERTVRRWWKTYVNQGFEEFIAGNGKRGRPQRLDHHGVESLKKEFEAGNLRTLESVRRWIQEQHNVEYSLEGVSRLLRTTLGIRKDWQTVDGSKPIAVAGANPYNSLVSASFLGFLNTLPTTPDVVQWITAFRDGLQTLLFDVDRITVVIDVACDLLNPGKLDKQQSVTQFVQAGDQKPSSLAVTSRDAEHAPSQRIVSSLASKGFTERIYHPPSCFEYYYQQREYIGVIVLWREKTKAPISRHTIEFLHLQEKFIEFLFSDLVARYQLAKPQGYVLNDAMAALNRDAELTEQEQKVVILQLLGHSYQQMADRLLISIETVRKHASNIYHKTNTGSAQELFAKYFTSRLGF
ncbi:MAG: helix-turn-helix domain-containing protein [Chlorobi bacterium]|nr:helix-turn-helix domain-containing protein [Chlorobiota bacterium]